jgi:XTP/dITP diphosphohydrolase
VKLLVATRSPGKQREFRELLAAGGVEAVFPDQAGLPPHPEEDRLELADTFELNAKAKAEYFALRAFLPTLADDSGIEVFALGGEPGVRSRRWAGAEGAEAEVTAANNALLLRRLAGAAEPRRRARYRCVLAYVPKPRAIAQVFEGACTGRILEEPRGESGFGYDPLFHCDDLGKSFGEATPEEKRSVSHRGRAVGAFLAYLKEHHP